MSASPLHAPKAPLAMTCSSKDGWVASAMLGSGACSGACSQPSSMAFAASGCPSTTRSRTAASASSIGCCMAASAGSGLLLDSFDCSNAETRASMKSNRPKISAEREGGRGGASAPGSTDPGGGASSATVSDKASSAAAKPWTCAWRERKHDDVHMPSNHETGDSASSGLSDKAPPPTELQQTPGPQRL